MPTVTLDEAQQRLGELVRQLPFAGEILITEGNKPVARLSAVAGTHSVLDIEPRSVGRILRAFPHPDDDILEEMLEDKLDKVFPRRDGK